MSVSLTETSLVAEISTKLDYLKQINEPFIITTQWLPTQTDFEAAWVAKGYALPINSGAEFIWKPNFSNADVRGLSNSTIAVYHAYNDGFHPSFQPNAATGIVVGSKVITALSNTQISLSTPNQIGVSSVVWNTSNFTDYNSASNPLLGYYEAGDYFVIRKAGDVLHRLNKAGGASVSLGVSAAGDHIATIGNLSYLFEAPSTVRIYNMVSNTVTAVTKPLSQLKAELIEQVRLLPAKKAIDNTLSNYSVPNGASTTSISFLFNDLIGVKILSTNLDQSLVIFNGKLFTTSTGVVYNQLMNYSFLPDDLLIRDLMVGATADIIFHGCFRPETGLTNISESYLYDRYRFIKVSVSSLRLNTARRIFITGLSGPPYNSGIMGPFASRFTEMKTTSPTNNETINSSSIPILGTTLTANRLSFDMTYQLLNDPYTGTGNLALNMLIQGSYRNGATRESFTTAALGGMSAEFYKYTKGTVPFWYINTSPSDTFLAGTRIQVTATRSRADAN